MKVLHTGDIHLREHNDERWEALGEIGKLIRDAGVDVVVIAGDLFDSEDSANVLYPRLRGVFEGWGIPVLILPGNHDAGFYSEKIDMGENVKVFHDIEGVDIEGTKFIGLPYRDVSCKEAFDLLMRAVSLKGEGVNILIYHGELAGWWSKGDWGDEQGSMPLELSFFRGLGIDYVLAGHFHSRYSVKPLPDGGFFVYPGSPVSVSVKEEGERGVNLFEVGKEPSFYVLPTFHYRKVEVRLGGGDVHPLDVIKSAIGGLPLYCHCRLYLSGWIDGARWQMDEKTLFEEIRGLGVEIVENSVRDIRTLREGGIFAKVVKKLKERGVEESRLGEMAEILLSAIIRGEKR